MYLGKSEVNTFEKGAAQEILLTNGRRGYAFSSVIGVNTRQDQGLLVVPLPGSEGHGVLVSKVDETLAIGGRRFLLSTNRYRDMVYPDGFRYIQEYFETPLPSVLFVLHSVFVRKTIFMVPGQPWTVVKYEVLASPERFQLEIRPLMAHRQRNLPGERRSCQSFRSHEMPPQGLCVEGRCMKTFFNATEGEWFLKELWFEGMLYGGDGLGSHDLEDVWSPGYLSLDLGAGETVYLVMGHTPVPGDFAVLRRMEKDAEASFERPFPRALGAWSESAKGLVRSAASLVSLGGPEGEPAIFSGYPSLRDLARDTFVALPGLTLATGRTGVAGAILDRWLRLAERHDGVMPGEVLSDGTTPLGPVDGGLWFFYALDKYCQYVGSFDKISLHWQNLTKLLDRYGEGIPALDLVCGENGLLHLTTVNPERHWMSGEVEGVPVVPRRGALVEINALWYNALRVMERFADIVEDRRSARRFGEGADAVRESFTKTFFNTAQGSLFDWVDGDERDDDIRPNQLLAVSLPCSPLEPEIGRSVLEVCWNGLYTTYGLRTLDAHSGKYKGRCEGRPDQRRKAWYRGMAWPWLLGQFVSAFLRYNPHQRDLGALFLRPFLHRPGGLGGVAELFDGSMPYDPHGDAVSAMSVGEILRVMEEDLRPLGL